MDSPSRRSVLRACGVALAGGIAGCVSGADDGDPTPDSTATAQPTDSPTDAPTETPTPTEISCEQQDPVDDLTVWNALDSAHTVAVTVTNTRDGAESVVFEETYEVPAGERTTTAVVFDGTAEGTYTLTAEADNGWTNSGEVTVVAENTFRYGINVELNGQAEALFISPIHGDPGPYHELGCER